MPEATRAGGPVHWHEMGTGEAPALMLHCALAHGGAWAGVLRHLGGRLRAVAPDMPGHGRSGDWDGRGDIHDQVTAIAETFLEPGAHVIGHSFGATVGLRLAMEHPGRVRSLVLIEPVLFAAASTYAPEVFADHERRSEPYVAAFRGGDAALGAKLFTGMWGDGQPWDTLSDRARDDFVARIGFVIAGNQALNHDSAGLLAEGRLESVRVPVLLIRGALSDPVVAAIHGALGARLPQAQHRVIDGAGHMVPLTHAEAVAGEIAAFLDAVTAG